MPQQLQDPEEITEGITSELKGVQFPLSQFNPWEAATLTNEAIERHLNLLHHATGTRYDPLASNDLSIPSWVQNVVAQAWHLSQRISPNGLNQHLAWRSAEQIFRFGMAYNRSTYFLTPYHSLFFSWENFGKETGHLRSRRRVSLSALSSRGNKLSSDRLLRRSFSLPDDQGHQQHSTKSRYHSLPRETRTMGKRKRQPEPIS
jgi:hypothetical protein